MHQTYCGPVLKSYIAKVTIDVQVNAVDEERAEKTIRENFDKYGNIKIAKIKESD